MINVLDHVQDARKCMENLIQVGKPGGYLIVGQDLTNDEDARKHPEGLQVGHPITLDEEWIAPFFADAFDTVLHRILPREAGWAPEWHYGTLVYAGIKR
jgi:hypothetical protein